MEKKINLKANSKIEFFLIHGYTGGLDDFNDFPRYLNEKYNANVKIALLKGHGTCVRDLVGLRYEDFLEQVESELKKSLNEGKKIILGGFSFGAQLALHLAAKYPVKGVFLISIPYKLKFPFNFPKLELFGIIKRHWKKANALEMAILRNSFTYYQHIPADGLKVVKKANKEIEGLLAAINVPLLLVHFNKDRISSRRSVVLLEKKVGSQKIRRVILKGKGHNIFYSNKRGQLYRAICNFFMANSEKDKQERIAAIVPAYNEGPRIASVLKALVDLPLLDQIIVVDDGSTDDTFQVASKFKKVMVLRNHKNRGKAYSMERGVKATDASIIFFCDADLKGLTPAIVEQIIKPVLNREYDMFIGVRNNVSQKAVKLAALNSGERALRRELWDKVPKEFKYRYRIEVGLNHIAKIKGNGYGWQKFNYYQTLKEKKYGFVEGTILRWRMNINVVWAYTAVILNKTILKKRSID